MNHGMQSWDIFIVLLFVFLCVHNGKFLMFIVSSLAT